MASKDLITKRFIEVVNYLLEGDKVKSKTELANALKVKNNKLSEVLNGRMKVGIDMVSELCEIYSINSDFVLNGKGDVLKTDTLSEEFEKFENEKSEGVSKIDIKNITISLMTYEKEFLKYPPFKIWYTRIQLEAKYGSL